ncbi:hypothetical protein ACHAXS_008013 [Conticribra weissflogii]
MVRLRFPRSPFHGGTSPSRIDRDSPSGDRINTTDTNDDSIGNTAASPRSILSPRNSNHRHRPINRQRSRRSQRLREQQQRRFEQHQLQRGAVASAALSSPRNPVQPTVHRPLDLSGISPSHPHSPASPSGTLQRRPFDGSDVNRTLPTSSSSPAPSIGLRRYLPSSSSTNSASKKKSSSNTISASFRRASSAMFRTSTLSTTPTTGSNSSPSTSRHELENGLNAHDSFETEDSMNTDEEEMERRQSVMGIMRAAGARPRSPDNDIRQNELNGTNENDHFPPLSLLSPNNGTYYAHAASVYFKEKTETDRDSVMEIDCDTLHSMDHNVHSQGILHWIRDDAPRDVLPKIFSYIGSRKLQTLSRVSRAWNEMTREESVWQVMCEDTGKWKEGDDHPESWLRFYENNPCVPYDFDTIDVALDAMSSGPRKEALDNNVRHCFREQRKTCRIIIHPGSYFLKRSLVFNCIGKAKVTLEAATQYSDPEHAMTWLRNYHTWTSMECVSQQAVSSPSKSVAGCHPRRTSASLRQMFGCRYHNSAANTFDSDESTGNGPEGVASGGTRGIHNQISYNDGPNPCPFLILDSKRRNEPVIRIRQGVVNIKGLKILHSCMGTDIWNGNAAVQVQPPFGTDGAPVRIAAPSVGPTANVSCCDIMSLSGRGFVNIDGGLSRIVDCNIHNSAATGIYVGGAGSRALITQTDVVENGNGDNRHNQGVARGHSGVYLEQGLAKIIDCNISKNSLTGISAVSGEHATLHIERSDLIANGSLQLEMPPIGTPSRNRSSSRDNTIAARGAMRLRSKFGKERAVANANLMSPTTALPPLPQSPSEFPNDHVMRAGHVMVVDN